MGYIVYSEKNGRHEILDYARNKIQALLMVRDFRANPAFQGEHIAFTLNG